MKMQAHVRCGMLLLLIITTGCNSSGSGSSKPQLAPASSENLRPVIVAPTAPAWTQRDKDWEKSFIPTPVDKYEILLPKEFAAHPNHEIKDADCQFFTWKSRQIEQMTPKLIVNLLRDDPQDISEIKKHAGKWLEVLAKSFAKSIKVIRPAEVGTLGGLEFTQIKWTGEDKSWTDDNNQAVIVKGISYVALDGDTIVTLHGLVYGAKPEKGTDGLEKIIATFRKKP